MDTIIFATGNKNKMIEIRMILADLGCKILSQKEAGIDRLEGVPDEKRTARFVCAIAAALPDGSTEVVRGTMEGRIGYEITGENGFGYDPIFYLPQFGCSSAELEPEKKNELSHRGEGLRKMRKVLEEKLESK